MANILKMEKKIQVVSALAEGSSIRSIERQTGIHRDTIMRLGVSVGQGCERLLSDSMRNLKGSYVEVDEIWGFVGKKKRNVTEADSSDLGDAWTFVAIDAETKAVPCFHVGKRDEASTQIFIDDLAGRFQNRIQLSSDAMQKYAAAVKKSFGREVDYAQIVKVYGGENVPGQGRYSPAHLVSTEKNNVIGHPDRFKISTSYVERQNLTMRMHVRRLTRLTNAFSKKLDNFKAAIGLHFGYYNFVKRHISLKTTPGVAAGVTTNIWTVADLIERAG